MIDVTEPQEKTPPLREVPGDKPVVLLGGSGMLGLALRAELDAREWPYLSPARRELDLAARSPGDRVMAYGPCLVINAAAFTDVAAAEEPRYQEVLFKINRSGAASIARACAKLGIQGYIVKPFKTDEIGPKVLTLHKEFQTTK